MDDIAPVLDLYALCVPLMLVLFSSDQRIQIPGPMGTLHCKDAGDFFFGRPASLMGGRVPI